MYIVTGSFVNVSRAGLVMYSRRKARCRGIGSDVYRVDLFSAGKQNDQRDCR
jgi:hypothetical protein